MPTKNLILSMILLGSLINTACSRQSTQEAPSEAQTTTTAAAADVEPADAPLTPEDENDFNPFAPDAKQQLEAFDKVRKENNLDADDSQTQSIAAPILASQGPCVYANRFKCAIYVQVVKDTQSLILYAGGRYITTWKVSTGREGFRTPNMDKHPDGRIYQAYSSLTYPGGDYKGLGNMPYAIFIRDGFALHGTPSISSLGQPASHGCIRIHPDQAQRLNAWVRQVGVSEVWVTVQDRL